MQLNPILFPAPRCRYAPDHLIGELLWIPKYKKTAITTIPPLSSHRTSQSLNSFEFSRDPYNIIRENATARTLNKGFSGTFTRPGTRQKEEFINHGHSKSAFSPNSDNEDQHRTKILDPIDYSDVFEIVGMRPQRFEEKENVSSFVNCYSFLDEEKDDIQYSVLRGPGEKSFSFKSPRSDARSENVSNELLDSPIRTGPIFLEKKFTRSQFSQKVSKASTAVRDDFSNIDFDHSSVAHSKKPSLKNFLQPCDLTIVNEDFEANYDVEIEEECPEEIDTFTNPKTISNYKLRTNEKTHLFKRLMTEYSFQTHGDTQTLKKTDLTGFYKEPKIQPKLGAIGHIPCLILKSGVPTNKLMLYFHGNGEDVYLSYDLLATIRNVLNVHVLAVEYPGYGLYKGDPSEEKILEDAEAVYEYLTQEMNLNPKNIIVFGRSIGSGPATWLASKREVGILVLMSAFTSIRGVVRDLAGKLIQYFVKERFNNLENIAKVKCPTFLVHGLKDTLIPYKHSQDLYNACTSPCELVLPKEMSHAEFDFHKDFTEPLLAFLRKGVINMENSDDQPLYFPVHLFGTPSTILKS